MPKILTQTSHAALSTSAAHNQNLKRYFQFALLLIGAGAIYPIIYLRQNFETTILSAFGISANELGTFYSTLGIIYALSYVPIHVTGLAIGIVSMIGYLPDIFLPMINAAITAHYSGVLGYRIYFSYIAVCGLLGTALAVYYKHLVKSERATS